MILTGEDIKRIIKDNPSKQTLKKAAEKNKLYRMHMYGDGLKESMPLIKGFEEPGLHELRAKYSKSNKSLFARLGRPIDKVFSARGGSIYYNLGDAQQKKAMEIVDNIHGGLSVKKWVQMYWRPHYSDDPDGIIMMEVGDGYTYPTYKSCQSIFSWLTDGDRFEYLMFKLSKQDKKAYGVQDVKGDVYRIVDDAADRLCSYSNDLVKEIPNQTFANPWGRVQAIRISNQIDPNDEELMLSIFDPIMELADEFLLKGSIKITHEFLHAYPKYWEFADDCDTCKGTGKVNTKQCPSCKGSTKSVVRKVSQVKLLNWPESKDDPNPAPHLGGYIEPSETFHKMSTTGLQMLEDLMHYTIWNREPATRTQGLESVPGQGPKTATEIVEGQSPMHERLHEVSDRAEKIIKFIIDSAIEAEVKIGYQGASVNLGRRYITENSDVIWKRYVEARKEGASAALLDELYREYIESKYSSDPLSMDIMIKLMSVEPFRHQSHEQVKALGVGDGVYKQKIFYSEWLNTMSDDLLISLSVENLRKSLEEYCNSMELAPKPEKTEVAA